LKTYLVIILSLSCFAINAQDTATVQDKSIKTQFEQTIKEGGRYQDYKVIKQRKLEELKNQTISRIEGLKDSINLLEKQIINKDKNTLLLEKQIKKKDLELTQISDEKNSISLFGIMLDKLTYNLILWTIIVALLLALFMIIFKYRNSNEITKVSQSNLKLVEEELENYKRRSIEREQQLSRQLMDERKKNNSSSNS